MKGKKQGLLAALSLDKKLLLKLKETTGSKQTIGNMFQVAMLGALFSVLTSVAGRRS